MKLVRIEASGFKSFADTVTFELGAGVTAFVGPNGCGKSNVVDAIRWALGEQSARSLRGKEMMDVIFNGCQGRPPAGLAEVTLVFDNASGRLPIPQAEVAVTRRLYRTGESEYLVNRQPCRLRDIRELFLDTGIGVEAYSVIEQGKVDLLLHANAQERRQIFEEAAGISRYRVKVKQATARLERVDQNLLRIRDLIRELDRQLKSIRRQAARARRARDLQEEWRSLRTVLALHRRAEFLAARDGAARRLEEIRGEEAAATAARAQLDEALAAAERERDALAASVRGIAVEIARQESERASLAEAAAARDARVAEAEAERADAAARAEAARERAREAAARAEAAEASVASLEADLAGKEEALGALEAEAARLQKEVEQALAAADRVRAAEMDAVRTRVAREGERRACARERDAVLARAQRARARAEEIARLLPAARAEVEARAAAHAACIAERQRLAAKAVYYRGDLERCLAEDAERRAEVEVFRYRLQGAEAARARAEAAEAEAREAGLGETLGRVQDFVQAPAGAFHAIASALGSHASDWLVRDLAGALQVVDRANEHRWAFTGVFPVERAARRESRFSDLPGVLGWASDMIEIEADLRPVVEALVGETLVVEDRAAALAILERRASIPFGRVVTLAGEVFERSGAISYRSDVPAAEPGATPSRRRLEEEIVRVSASIEQLEARRAEIHAKREEAQRILEEVERLVAERDREAAALAGELEEKKAAARRLVQEMDLAAGEAAQAVAEADVLAMRLVDMDLASLEAPEAAGESGHAARVQGEAAAACETLREAWSACEERLKGARTASQAAREALARARSAALEAHQARAREEEEIARQEASGRALEDRLRRDAAEAEATRARAGALEADLASGRARLAQAEAALEEHRREMEASVVARNEAVRREEEIARRLTEARVAEREAALKLAAEEERAREELQVDLAAAAEGYAEEPRDWEAAARRAEELRAELARCGGVDLEALSEEADLERRHSFLVAQEEDLTRAREGLADLIRRMNKISRERFAETFERIRANFQDAFRKLFGGGKADILLSEEADVLEAGIEIVARPPGKEPRSISLLSGGEKSMTAVALLFAVFQSRPSPFCILDEADAALDETNVDRFVGIVKEFLATSQFLVITHNKRTMRIADRLYGLTQETPGISIPVSLAFEEIESS